jgi:hypothetical protein
LFVTGVTGCAEHPLVRGGFGEIFQASYGEDRVALKRLRTFQGDADQRSIQSVCPSTQFSFGGIALGRNFFMRLSFGEI